MRYLSVGLLSLSTLAGCQQSTSSVPPTKSVEQAQATAPAKFEIRDFSIDEQRQSYGGVVYKGRGTLVTRDVAVSKGNYMVWITVKQAHKNDDVWKSLVLLHDGIGTIETHDYQSKDDVKSVKYYDWKILGYAALSTGIIEQEAGTVPDRK